MKSLKKINFKPVLKYVGLGVLLVVLYYIFKPAEAPTSSVVSNKGTAKNVNPLDFGLGADFTEELPEKGHLWFTKEQLIKIDEERKRAGRFDLGDVKWGDYAVNADSKFDSDDKSRGPVTGVFKGLDIKPTGKGCWILEKEILTILAKAKPAKPHWDVIKNEYLTV